MSILYTIISFLVLIGVVVFFHEGGHYLFCKIGNIKVLEFSIGFGPKIFSKVFSKDRTVFTVRLFPLGGFVRPLDKNSMTVDDWNKLNSDDKARSIGNAKKYHQILMALGGPLMNFILAFFVFWLAFSFIGNKEIKPIVGEVIANSIFQNSGIESGEVLYKINGDNIQTASDAYQIIASHTIEGEDIVVETNKRTTTVHLSQISLKNLGDDLGKITGMYLKTTDGDIKITNLTPNMPGVIAGLEVGDKIESVDGNYSKDLGQLMRLIKRSPNKDIEFKILRGDELITLKVKPLEENNKKETIGKIGVEFESLNSTSFLYNKDEVFSGAAKSYHKVVSSTKTTVVSLFKIITGEISTKTISGPISIADFSGKSASKGLYTYLVLMGMISIAVGVFNLIPIPILDGGHVIIYTLEALRKECFTIEQLRKFQFVGVLCMIAVFTVAISNDLTKYLS